MMPAGGPGLLTLKDHRAWEPRITISWQSIDRKIWYPRRVSESHARESPGIIEKSLLFRNGSSSNYYSVRRYWTGLCPVGRASRKTLCALSSRC